MNWQNLKLTTRALRSRPSRIFIILGGIAATSMLVLFLLATHGSLTHGVKSYIGQSNIDLWIAPKGSDNLIRTSSFLPVVNDANAFAETGIKKAGPVMRSFVNVKPFLYDGKKGQKGIDLFGIGYTPGGLGGPPIISEGRKPEQINEVVMDRGAAFRIGVKPGDSLIVNENTVKLVGLSRGTNLITSQFLFCDIRYIWNSISIKDKASFILLQLEPGINPDSVASKIEKRFPETNVFTRAEFIQNNLFEVVSGIMPIIALITFLGVCVSSVLVVLIIQGLIEDKRSEIAVQLALGNSVSVILASLLYRTLLWITYGCVFGSLLAIGLSVILDSLAPHIELTFSATHFFIVFFTFIIAGIIAVLIPLLRLKNIDPINAFRS